MRVLVTGGAGFIGSTLAEALIVRGHDVVVVDDLSRGCRDYVPSGATLHVCDIASIDLRALLCSRQPEVVFHLGAHIDLRRSIADPLLDTRINVLGTVNLLQACVEAGTTRLVFASSGAVYGDTSALPIKETHPLRPSSPYGAAKQSGEVYGHAFQRLHGLQFVALRYANVYGPRQQSEGEAGVVAIFSHQMLHDEPAVINGDGAQTRDFVHVDDVVRANIRAMETEHVGVYNVGTGRETDVNTVYSLLARACGSRRAPIHGPAKPGDARRGSLDIRLADEMLGWRPQVELEQGLSDMVAYCGVRR